MSIVRSEPRTAVLGAAENIARDTYLYRLVLDQPLPFTAGQFVNLTVPDARPRGERSYSVWSSPADPSVMELCIKLFEGGAASEYLRRAQVGDLLNIRGPYGIFTLRPEHETVTFVATATGLAPFHSMLQACAAVGDPRRFRMYFGVRSQEDLFGVDILADLAQRLPDFRYQVCLSRPEAGWDGYTGRVTAALKADFTGAPDHYYLCGNGAMIEETREFLKGQGLDRKSIHVEKYY